MKLNSKQKNNFFWFFLVPTLILITLTISLSPWAFELLSTPSDRFFTGINRFSTDYFIYLSYVEIGRRGDILAKLLINTIPQKGVFAHTVHTLGGFIFGHLFNLSSPAAYHLTRSFWSLVFLLSVILFFYRISRSKKMTALAFFLTFFVSGFAKIISFKPLQGDLYLSWLQEQNIIGRASGPIHYNAGFVFFILSFLWFFSVQTLSWKKILVFGLLLNLCLNSNPFAYLILILSFGLYIVFKLFFLKQKLHELKKEILFLFLGFLLSLPLLLYNQKFLSFEPWGKYGMSPKFYVINHPPLPFFDTILSIGPIFFLGIAGIIVFLFKKKGNWPNTHIFMIAWLLCQFILFFSGDMLKIHPLRAFSGLYYLPLAFFSALLIQQFFNKKLIIICLFLFLITLSGYYLAYRQQLFAFTDFKNYALFTFPTKKQGEAFSFMEKNLPSGKGVLALYEASSLIPSLSGCATELDMSHELKSKFYSREINEKQAYEFLKENNFSYVYFGYQEKYYGREFEKYPFIKRVFYNEEVDIYQIL